MWRPVALKVNCMCQKNFITNSRVKVLKQNVHFVLKFLVILKEKKLETIN